MIKYPLEQSYRNFYYYTILLKNILIDEIVKILISRVRWQVLIEITIVNNNFFPILWVLYSFDIYKKLYGISLLNKQTTAYNQQ